MSISSAKKITNLLLKKFKKLYLEILLVKEQIRCN